MENEMFVNFCNLLERVTTNKEEICVTFSCKVGNMTMTFVPYEYSYHDGIYIESREEDSVKINHIDAIFYDEMEEIFNITCGEVSIFISRLPN